MKRVIKLELTRPELILLMRRFYHECADIGKVCPPRCRNIDKRCIKISEQVEKKLLEATK